MKQSNSHLPLIFSLMIIWSCSESIDPKIAEQEILETEQAFAAMSKKEGIAKAFLAYAADDAVLMRNNQLIIGKDSISRRFNNAPKPPEGTQLDWKADFVDVAASGDLGYTYGTYVLTSIDSTGRTLRNEGIFHTVWKRQEDGRWKFVWD